MIIHTDLNPVSPFESAIALGYFDGLHLAHRKIIDCVMKSSKRFIPTVFTFSLKEGEAKGTNVQKPIMSLEERLCAIEEIGVSQVWVPSFESIKELSAEDFFYEFLVKKLRAGKICCGFNFRFGKKNSGDVNLLKKLCEENEIELVVTDEIKLGSEAISSTAIRNYLKLGECEKLKEMLGDYYTVCGEVIHGNGIGKKLDFPTINQVLNDKKTLPRYGVYISKVEVDGEVLPSVTNVGVKPTVGSNVPCSETHLIDFKGNLYGKKLKVKLIKFLRDEVAFENIDSLKEAVERDISYAKEYFGK